MRTTLWTLPQSWEVKPALVSNIAIMTILLLFSRGKRVYIGIYWTVTHKSWKGDKKYYSCKEHREKNSSIVFYVELFLPQLARSVDSLMQILIILYHCSLLSPNESLSRLKQSLLWRVFWPGSSAVSFNTRLRELFSISWNAAYRACDDPTVVCVSVVWRNANI